MSVLRTSTERQVLRELKWLLEDEAGTMCRYLIKYWSITIVGLAMVCGGYFSILIWHRSAVLLCGVAILGGMLTGCTSVYWAAYTQWPAIKRYINAEAIRNDLNELEAEEAAATDRT